MFIDQRKTALKEESKSTSAGSVHRAGKSLFVGTDGDMHGVEEMVKQNLALRQPDYSKNTLCKQWGIKNIDEIDDIQFLQAAQGGGWSGWHCEGSPLRALFALCMWHVLFPNSN